MPSLNQKLTKKSETVEGCRMSNKHYDAFRFGAFEIDSNIMRSLSSRDWFKELKRHVYDYTSVVKHSLEAGQVEEKRNVQVPMRNLLPKLVATFFRDESLTVTPEVPYKVTELAEFHVTGLIDEAVRLFDTTVLLPVEDKNLNIDLSDQTLR